MRKAFFILSLFTLLVFGGCADSTGPDLPEVPDGQTRFSLSLRVPRAGVGTRAEDDGTADECMITKPKLRILVFKAADNKFLTEMEILNLSSKNNGTFTDYDLLVAATGIEKGMKLRFVALANWPGSPECKVGETTIDKICTNDKLLFDATGLTQKIGTEDFFMPMYGVEYAQMAFDTTGEYVGEPITLYMLRALAKIEVSVKDNSAYNLESVSLVNANGHAYCAPYEVYERQDYYPDDQSKGWFTKLHIPENPTISTFSFKRLPDTDFPVTNPIVDKTRNSFVIYVPEIANLSQADQSKRPYLLMKFKGINDKAYSVYFRNNNEQTGLYDIHRNWWYRISVSKSGPLQVTVTLAPYTGVHLQPEFGFDYLIDKENEIDIEDSYENLGDIMDDIILPQT